MGVGWASGVTWALVLAGCAGAGPSSAMHAPAPSARGTDRIEIAQGEMRQVLLQLARVHFALDSTELTPSSRAALRRVVEVLRAHPDVTLFIEGHADPRGAPEYNLGLGQQRAATVERYCRELGIAPARLQVTSYGEERPLSTDPDQAGLARNRRVEFRLLRGQVRLVLEEGSLVDDHGNPI